MKIAALHMFLSELRGGNLVFLDMVSYLKRRGHEVDTFVLDTSEYFEKKLREVNIEITSLNFKAWKIKGLNAYLNIINELRAIYLYYRLARKLNKNDYDLAFVHHSILSPLILPFLKIPKVYYCHEPPRAFYEPLIVKDWKHKIYNLFLFVPYLIDRCIDRYCVEFADLILTNSDYSCESIWRAYGRFAITNRLGVDTSIFRKMDEEKENLVISLGVLHPRKAHELVIESIGLIPPEKRPSLLIIGAGQIKKEFYCNLAKKNNVELEIKSNISDKELVALYNKAKVFAIAYIMEPSIEPAALGCELPIVAVREGGARETIIHGETGILTNRDEREFAQAIEYLLDNPDKAAEMGRKGREWIENNFTWEMCAENLERNFAKVLANSKP